ncbi:MAG: sulfite exporter TauE/SafE family protein [Acidimicrobiales bacterium]
MFALSTAEFIVVGIAVFFSSLVQTVTGFGFSLLAVPIMAMALPIDLAVVISATLSTFTSGGQAISERHHGDRPTIKRLVIAAFVGAPLGLLILDFATSQQLKIGLAIVIVLFLIVNLRGFRLEKPSTPVDLAAGFVAGVLSTSLSTNGPPLVMALHARHFAPQVFRGTIAAVFVSVGALSLGLFAATGHFTTDVAWSLLVAGPSLAAGYFLGFQIRGHVNPRRFRGLVTILLAATAVVTVISVVVG